MKVLFEQAEASSQAKSYLTSLKKTLAAYPTQNLSQSFTKELAKWTGHIYCLEMPSKARALASALGYYNIEQGDSVLCSPFVQHDLLHLLLSKGIGVSFYDLNENGLSPSLASIKITDTCKAMIVDYPFLYPFDARPLADFCMEKSLVCIESLPDLAARAVGQRSMGNVGHFSIMGFHPKNFLQAADGATLMTDDGKLASFIRNHARKLPQMGDFLAAIGLNFLEEEDQEHQTSKKLADRYYHAFKPFDSIGTFLEPGRWRWRRKGFPIVLDEDRKLRLRTTLARHGIEARLAPTLSTENSFVEARLQPHRLNNALKYSRQILLLPLYSSLSVAQQDHIIGVVLKELT